MVNFYVEGSIKKFEQMPRNWRAKELYVFDTNKVFTVNRIPLLQIYRSRGSGEKHNLLMEDAIKIFQNDEIRDIGVT